MMEDTRGRDINATFSGGETFKQTSGHARNNSLHFIKTSLSEDCDYFNRTGLQTSVDRHLENDLSHSMSRDNDEEVERVNEEEVSFFKDDLKNDSGE